MWITINSVLYNADHFSRIVLSDDRIVIVRPGKGDLILLFETRIRANEVYRDLRNLLSPGLNINVVTGQG